MRQPDIEIYLKDADVDYKAIAAWLGTALGPFHGIKQHRGLRRLLALPVIPSGVAQISQSQHRQERADGIAPLRPKMLELIELFLLF